MVYFDSSLTNGSAFTSGILSGDKASLEGKVTDVTEPACITVAVCTARFKLTACSLVGCEGTSCES